MNKRRRLAWWLWLPVFIALLVVAWKIGRKEPPEPWPVLCLHADGKVTLGSFEGRSLSREDLLALGKTLQSDSSQPYLIMKPAADLPIEKWYDTICATAEGGVGYYQFKSAFRKLAFRLPGCGYPPRDTPSPKVIDLRDGETDDREQQDPWFSADGMSSDVHVITRRSISFEELHDAIAPDLRPGVSMVIAGPRLSLMRDRDADLRIMPQKDSSGWERMKERVPDWVK